MCSRRVRSIRARTRGPAARCLCARSPSRGPPGATRWRNWSNGATLHVRVYRLESVGSRVTGGTRRAAPLHVHGAACLVPQHPT